MSTRANILIKDEDGMLYFYRHSDGYPESTGEDLKEFVKGYQTGAMRLDLGQSAGWLIIRGHKEYFGENQTFTGSPNPLDRSYGWKVGAYEPTTDIHGDIDYLYTIDLENKILSCARANGELVESFPPIYFAKD